MNDSEIGPVQEAETIPGLKFRDEEVARKQFELELHIWPDPTLKAPTMDFPEAHVGAPIVRRTAEKMLEMMYKLNGVGLAAQQVGVPFRIFVMDQQKEGNRTPRVFLNPKITEMGEELVCVTGGEGCLSFPYGVKSPVARLNKLELEWLDYDGQVHHEWFEGTESVIIQHEMDHLMGFCFIDRISWLRRNLAIRKARRIRAQYKKGMRKTLRAMKNAPRTPAFNMKRMQMFEATQRAKELSNGIGSTATGQESTDCSNT